MGWGGFGVEDSQGMAIHAGFLGFAGSGKTTTAFLLGAALARLRGSDTVAMFDTEGGGRWLAPTAAALGVNLIGERARSFAALELFVAECNRANPGAVLIDSLTHIWTDLCDAHLERINARQARFNRPAQDKLEFQDWSAVKGDWGRFADWLVSTDLHVMVCGRAGYKYEMETNERGKRELLKVGLKMKAEGEFTFEPDVVIEMRRLEEEGKDGFVLSREAAILKARGLNLDGRVLPFPKTNDPQAQLRAVEAQFAELLERAKGKAPKGAGVNLDKTKLEDQEESRLHRGRTLGDIKGVLNRLSPGATNEARGARAEAVRSVFGCDSWQSVELLPIEALEQGLLDLKNREQAAIPADGVHF